MCLQRKYTEQIQLNEQLTGEISELRQEALVIQEIPRRLCESVASCKDFYEDLLSTVQVKPVHYACCYEILSSNTQVTDIHFLSFFIKIEFLN